MDIDGSEDVVQEDKVDNDKAKCQSALFGEFHHDRDGCVYWTTKCHTLVEFGRCVSAIVCENEMAT